jgi:hypothetical protein
MFIIMNAMFQNHRMFLNMNMIPFPEFFRAGPREPDSR